MDSRNNTRTILLKCPHGSCCNRELTGILFHQVEVSRGQATQARYDNTLSTSALDYKVARFNLTDSTLIGGLSKLSLERIAGLHLGFEEIPREELSDPQDHSVRFSLSLENTTVRDIVGTLCQFDNRYTWSTDGPSINVYPREIIGDPSYFLNREVEQINLTDIRDPDQALTPLARQFPNGHIGYIQMGGDISYGKPWTARFEQVTVRQFTNRIAEHIGSQSSWIWQGGKDSRMFTFIKGGFQTQLVKHRHTS